MNLPKARFLVALWLLSFGVGAVCIDAAAFAQPTSGSRADDLKDVIARVTDPDRETRMSIGSEH